MPRATPIRVLSLTYAEDSFLNAQQVNAREIAKRLDPARFEMTLLSDASGPSAVAELPHVRTLVLPSRGRARKILRHLCSNRFELVLYPGPGFPESVYLRLPRWMPGRRARVLMPVEGDVRQLDEVEPWIRRRVDRIHRRADALYPITEYVAAGLLRRCGRTGLVVPVGVDTVEFLPRAGERAWK